MALCLGPKFVFTPKLNLEHLLNVEFEAFARRLRLRGCFREGDGVTASVSQPQGRLYVPSNWDPRTSTRPEHHTPSIERYLRATRAELKKAIDELSPDTVRRFGASNQERRILRFLREMREHPQVTLKNADKNLGLTVVGREWYEQEAQKQLSDQSTYRLVKEEKEVKDTIDKVVRRTKALSQFLKKFEKNEMESKFLDHKMKNSGKKLPFFYIMPKLHKNPVTGRPIVAQVDWVSTPLSIWLNERLRKFMPLADSLLQDSRDMVIRIENMTPITENKDDYVLVTMDVKELYTRIPNDLGLAELKRFLKIRAELSDSEAQKLVDTMQLILESSYFEFNGQIFKQIKGTAMGAAASVPYANIWLYCRMDWRLRQSDEVELYGRLLDDVFLLCRKSYVKEMERILARIHENSNGSIECKISVHDQSIDFLDLTIFKGERWEREGILDVKLFEKPTNRFLYIPATSCHPAAAKKGWITTELIRMVRNNSSENLFNQKKEEFRERLQKRGFTPALISQAFEKIRYQDREKWIRRDVEKTRKGNPNVFFSTTWNPIFKKVLPLQKILMKHWHLVNEEPAIFKMEGRPMVAWKKGQSLGQIAIRAKYRSYKPAKP